MMHTRTVRVEQKHGSNAHSSPSHHTKTKTRGKFVTVWVDRNGSGTKIWSLPVRMIRRFTHLVDDKAKLANGSDVQVWLSGESQVSPPVAAFQPVKTFMQRNESTIGSLGPIISESESTWYALEDLLGILAAAVALNLRSRSTLLNLRALVLRKISSSKPLTSDMQLAWELLPGDVGVQARILNRFRYGSHSAEDSERFANYVRSQPTLQALHDKINRPKVASKPQPQSKFRTYPRNHQAYLDLRLRGGIKI